MTNQSNILVHGYGEENFFPVFGVFNLESMFNKITNIVYAFFKIPIFESSIESDENIKDMLEFQKGDNYWKF